MQVQRHLWVAEWWDNKAKAWTCMEPRENATTDDDPFDAYSRRVIRHLVRQDRSVLGSEPKIRIRMYTPAKED